MTGVGSEGPLADAGGTGIRRRRVAHCACLRGRVHSKCSRSREMGRPGQGTQGSPLTPWLLYFSLPLNTYWSRQFVLFCFVF